MRERTPKAKHRFEKSNSAWDLSVKQQTVKRPVSPVTTTMRVNKPVVYQQRASIPLVQNIQQKVITHTQDAI
jgi:hypothetical protein